MKKPNKKRTWWTRALGAGAMLTVSAVAAAGILPSMSEKPMAAWSMVYGTEMAQASMIKLFGIAQPGYQYVQSDKGNVTTSGAQFKLYRMRAGIRGAISPNIDYYFLAQFDDHSPGTSSASLFNATVTLNYIPGAHVIVGQMMAPFADEGVTPAGVLPWVNYSPMTYNIGYNENTVASLPNGNGGANVGAGLFNSARERGVMIFDQFRGGMASVDYALGYYNGTGVHENASSMGHPDEFLGHVGAGLGPFDMSVGYVGAHQTISGAVYQQKKLSFDLHYGNYTKDPFWLWYEYQHANDTQPATANGNGLARGWFAAGGIRPVKHFMAVLRYSTYNAENVLAVSTNGTNSSPTAPVFGATPATTSLNEESVIGIYLAPKGVRYLLELDRTTFNNTSQPAADAVSVMLSVPFGARLVS
ncbi:MAG TPA: hypothetical protein VMV40_05275 [Acidiferrobacter sp.]|nr:hypothetical protein [Acidiferrobacter sp.]